MRAHHRATRDSQTAPQAAAGSGGTLGPRWARGCLDRLGRIRFVAGCDARFGVCRSVRSPASRAGDRNTRGREQDGGQLQRQHRGRAGRADAGVAVSLRPGRLCERRRWCDILGVARAGGHRRAYPPVAAGRQLAGRCDDRLVRPPVHRNGQRDLPLVVEPRRPRACGGRGRDARLSGRADRRSGYRPSYACLHRADRHRRLALSADRPLDVYADASGARRVSSDVRTDLYNTKLGMEWTTKKPSALGFEKGALGLQFDSGLRMSLRVRRGGIGMYLRSQF